MAPCLDVYGEPRGQKLPRGDGNKPGTPGDPQSLLKTDAKRMKGLGLSRKLVYAKSIPLELPPKGTLLDGVSSLTGIVTKLSPQCLSVLT
jgi:hypothetical protein